MKVCDQCFCDNEIKQFIVATSTLHGVCECCSKEGHLIEIEELLDFFLEFVSIFKHDESVDKSLIEIIQEDWDIFTSREIGTKLLSGIDFSTAIGLDYDVFLANNGLNLQMPVSYIEEIGGIISFWTNLKEDLKWERRFLTDIDEITGLNWNSMFGVSAKIDSHNLLFRARINQNGQIAPYKKEEMGIPEKIISTGGRANPQGIPYLYLCKTLETTLYEIRATFLDNISIGIFHIKDDFELNLVDFTRKQSPFNQEGQIISFTKQRLIMDAISRDLSKPLRRYDSELEYIPTQFICEYIRFNVEADGIQFNSSLEKGGVNIVLFNQDNIECIDVEVHQIEEVKIKSRRIS
jgi:hypothetical protein